MSCEIIKQDGGLAKLPCLEVGENVWPKKSTDLIKFIYSEKATNFCEIFPLLLTVCTVVKSKGKILQNFVAFSDYKNFIFVGIFKKIQID